MKIKILSGYLQNVLVCLIMSIVVLSQGAEPADSKIRWEYFKQRFITPEGRVIDDANHDVSHSEGQGYGLILAEGLDDLETFERLWNWTDKNLSCRVDHLFAWRWVPNEGVLDKNNATDGDLFIAWALSLAATKWQRPLWQERAAQIARDIRTKLCIESNQGILLLPGMLGFRKKEGVVINLSYWVFPAFEELHKIDPSPQWKRLADNGVALIRKARFSEHRLPPDWLLVTKSKVEVAREMSADYGYNAVRVPLYLAWARVVDEDLYEPFRAFSDSQGNVPPATVNLPENKLGKDPALSGMISVYRLVAGTGNLPAGILPIPYEVITAEEPYFSVSLGLLSNLAASKNQEEFRSEKTE